MTTGDHWLPLPPDLPSSQADPHLTRIPGRRVATVVVQV